MNMFPHPECTKQTRTTQQNNNNQNNSIQNNNVNFNNIQNELSEEPLTFIHGDVKSPNIFFRRDMETFTPYFIDWQHCAIGKGVQDIIFFIIESFDISNISITFNLIKHYFIL